MQYRYVKKTPNIKKNNQKTKLWKLLPFFLVIIGGGFIFSVLFPIFSYQFFVSPQVAALVSPATKIVLGESTVATDYSQVSSWLPTSPKLPPLPSKITHYTITIPSLKITAASVEIGGKDLNKSLIHYQGTAFPGQRGNAVIFGHSALPQFFGPKNYLSIFAYLPSIKNGDEIFVDFDGVLYKYVVKEITEVTPNDISILEQKYDDSYLTLVTCVPPGTIFRRLVVKARIEKI